MNCGGSPPRASAPTRKREWWRPRGRCSAGAPGALGHLGRPRYGARGGGRQGYMARGLAATRWVVVDATAAVTPPVLLCGGDPGGSQFGGIPRRAAAAGAIAVSGVAPCLHPIRGGQKPARSKALGGHGDSEGMVGRVDASKGSSRRARKSKGFRFACRLNSTWSRGGPRDVEEARTAVSG